MFYEEMFLSKPTFEKIAVTTKLPDDHTKWAPKVLSELHRQVPVMEEFHSTIVLDRVDANKGVGFGYIVAQPKTLNPMMSGSLPKIKIPIVINGWKLSPIDVFYTKEGKGLPLNERRVRQELLRAEPFDAAAPKDMTTSGDVRSMLTPPWENVGQFYRGVNTQVSSGQVKTSGLLNRLHRTVHKKDLVKVANWIKSDEGRSSLFGDEDVKGKFLQALRLKPYEDFAKVAHVEGPVITQYKWNGGPVVMIKTAQPGAFNPQQQAQPAQQATQQMGQQQQQQHQQSGEATQAPQLAVMQPVEMEMDQYMPVQTFGVYKVISVQSEQLVGWVFPFILSFEMQKVPMQVFTDGTNFAMQQSIPGVHMSGSLNLPNEKPQNRGMFYLVKNGKAFGFAPVEIMGEQATPEGGVMYMCKTLMGGNDIQVVKVQGIQGAAVMGENVYGIPMEVKWLPFKQQSNPLVEEPQKATMRGNQFMMERIQQLQQQQAAAQQAEAEKGKKGRKKQASLNAVIRQTREGSYSLSGTPFEKLANEHTQFLDQGDTVWMMALAGVDPDYTREKLASIGHSLGYLEIPVFREVVPPEIHVEKIASRERFIQPLKKDLLKHASVFGDPLIADTLLSLNFLSSKNIHMFMNYMPQLEEAIHGLVNLLVASRVGLKEIQEDACVVAIKGIEDVINGIKMLMLREGSI